MADDQGGLFTEEPICKCRPSEGGVITKDCPIHRRKTHTETKDDGQEPTPRSD